MPPGTATFAGGPEPLTAQKRPGLGKKLQNEPRVHPGDRIRPGDRDRHYIVKDHPAGSVGEENHGISWDGDKQDQQFQP